MPSVPIVMPSEIAMVLNSIGVPPAARMPSLTFSASARRWKLHGIVSIQVLATPMIGLRERLVVVADALELGARRPRGPGRRRTTRVVLGSSLRRGSSRSWPVPSDGGRRSVGGGRRACGARRARGARAPTGRGARGRAGACCGSSWRPGRCMLASAIRRRSSPLSAIHLASTSSESGSRVEPYGPRLVGELDAVLVQQPARLRQVGHDRLVRVDEVGVAVRRAGRARARLAVGPDSPPHTRMKPRSRYIAHSSSLTHERSSSRARCSARRSRPGS